MLRHGEMKPCYWQFCVQATPCSKAFKVLHNKLAYQSAASYYLCRGILPKISCLTFITKSYQFSDGPSHWLQVINTYFNNLLSFSLFSSCITYVLIDLSQEHSLQCIKFSCHLFCEVF